MEFYANIWIVRKIEKFKTELVFSQINLGLNGQLFP